MRLNIEVELDYALARPADVLLQIEAAALPDQRIVSEALTIWSDVPIRAVAGEDGIGQRCWVHAVGRCTASYRAIVDVDRPKVQLADHSATPVRALPETLIPYVLPSRYCQADRFVGFVEREFAGLEGGPLATALTDWVRTSLDYGSRDSSGETTALDTFATRRGVCRDFAHLLVALARAGNIPARCVSVYAPGVDPPDFHAVAELWLGGRWHLVDATGMASCQDLVRVAVGRDATDIAFMTIFGEADLVRQQVRVTQERAQASVVLLPNRLQEAFVTDISKSAIDSLSVAPDAGEQDIVDERQQAGQDKSTAKRLEKNPESADARLDNALDESMDASDPPASTQPVHSTEPPASSGFDPAAERKLQQP